MCEDAQWHPSGSSRSGMLLAFVYEWILTGANTGADGTDRDRLFTEQSRIADYGAPRMQHSERIDLAYQ